MEISMAVVKPHAFALKPTHNRPKHQKIVHKLRPKMSKTPLKF